MESYSYYTLWSFEAKSCLQTNCYVHKNTTELGISNTFCPINPILLLSLFQDQKKKSNKKCEKNSLSLSKSVGKVSPLYISNFESDIFNSGLYENTYWQLFQSGNKWQAKKTGRRFLDTQLFRISKSVFHNWEWRKTSTPLHDSGKV